MAQHYDPDDVPSLGEIRDGYGLVCYGDEKPEEWLDWLGDTVAKFEDPKAQADRFKVDLEWEGGVLEDWRSVCHVLGVSLESEFWESSLVSGQYQTGWLAADDLKKAYGDLVRTREEARLANSTELDRRVLRFACQVFTGASPPRLAGPLVLWPVVRLHEVTMTGYHLNPFYRKGGQHASQWLTPWLDGAKYRREFRTSDRQLCATALEIVQAAPAMSLEQVE
ncbi:MAG: hypothetical protein WCG80_02175 [Spirochaetales bacterium]